MHPFENIVTFLIFSFILFILVLEHLAYEPCYEKTGFLHLRKQRRRSAAK